MSEELDDLASAYVDGEASPSEMARVEGDPALLDLVEEFRSLRTSKPLSEASHELRAVHLAAALDTFDQQRAGRTSFASASTTASSAEQAPTFAVENASPVEHAGTHGPAGTTRSTVTSLSKRRARKGPPGWLLNAAAAVVVIGGVGFALTQLSDSADDAATDVFDAAAIEEEAGDMSSAAPNDNRDDAGSTQALQSESAEADAASATDESSADEEASSSEADDSGVMGEDTDEDEVGGPTSTTVSATDPGPLEAVGDETATELLAILEQGSGYEAMLSPEGDECLTIVADESATRAAVALGVVAINYGEVDALLLLYGDEASPTPILVTPDCTILSAD